MTKTKQYYASGNTAKGLVNLLHTNITNVDQIIVLNHPAHTLKTAILKNLIHHFKTEYSLEIIHSPYGEDYLEGLIIRNKSLAIITDTIASTKDFKTADIHLENYLKGQDENASDNFLPNQYRKQAYEFLAQGLAIHDRLEEIFIDEMDFSKADEIAENLILKIFGHVPKQEHKPVIYRRFFGTTLAKGPVNLVSSIIENMAQRVYVKGRAGTGKSVFMKKIANKCEDLGLDVELYHCSFDPDSIDMVLVPELSFCIFDSTKPHEFFSDRSGDIVIDLYEEAVAPGTDEKYAKEINEVTQHYKSHLKQGTDKLKEAELFQKEIEKNYSFTVDDVNEIMSAVLKHII